MREHENPISNRFCYRGKFGLCDVLNARLCGPEYIKKAAWF